jgi:phosphoheptose isomerase
MPLRSFTPKAKSIATKIITRVQNVYTILLLQQKFREKISKNKKYNKMVKPTFFDANWFATEVANNFAKNRRLLQQKSISLQNSSKWSRNN